MPERVSPLLSVALLALWVSGCNGGDAAPVIEITDFTPEVVVPSDDQANDVLMLLHYIDDDGDIGGGELRMFDCRNDDAPTVSEFPVVASQDAVDKGVSLDGVLNVFLFDIMPVERVVPSSCAVFGAPELLADELAYCIEVIDDSGNLSNAACSPIVTIAGP